MSKSFTLPSDKNCHKNATLDSTDIYLIVSDSEQEFFMNPLGVSSACFYPALTESSVDSLGKMGIRHTELFINTFSETQPDFLRLLIEKKENYGMDIISVHPFTSFAESFCLFSNYYRRYTDILPFYENFFEFTARLGARYFVIHGAKIPGTVSDTEYFDRFAHLIEIGKKYGVSVCQENVVHYRSESPDYLSAMAKYIGSDFGMVLDIKQARRAGYSPYDFANALSPYIKHIHISDYNEEKDCVPPLSGCFDFEKFFRTMKTYNYTGAYMIELYEHSYNNCEEIRNSYENTKKLLKLLF